MNCHASIPIPVTFLFGLSFQHPQALPKSSLPLIQTLSGAWLEQDSTVSLCDTILEYGFGSVCRKCCKGSGPIPSDLQYVILCIPSVSQAQPELLSAMFVLFALKSCLSRDRKIHQEGVQVFILGKSEKNQSHSPFHL